MQTYESYMKYSRFSRIIITNKTKREGYIKYPGLIYERLYDRNDILYDSRYMENLEEYIKNEKNYDTYTRVNGKLKEIRYEFDKIIKDVCDKCYEKTPTEYKLSYEELIILTRRLNGAEHYIYNTISNKFTKVDDVIGDKVLYSESRRGFFKIDYDVNTDVVTNILHSLITDDILKKYREFAYKVFVNQTEELNIFYDDSCEKDKLCNRSNLLSEWLYSCVEMCDSNGVLLLHKYETIKELKAYVKKMQNKPRLGIINNKTMRGIDVAFDDKVLILKNLGIMNILVIDINDGSNLYDFKGYKKYLNENNEYIMSKIADKRTWSSKQYIHQEIFTYPDCLLTNYLEWCCMS